MVCPSASTLLPQPSSLYKAKNGTTVSSSQSTSKSPSGSSSAGSPQPPPSRFWSPGHSFHEMPSLLNQSIKSTKTKLSPAKAPEAIRASPSAAAARPRESLRIISCSHSFGKVVREIHDMCHPAEKALLDLLILQGMRQRDQVKELNRAELGAEVHGPVVPWDPPAGTKDVFRHSR